MPTTTSSFKRALAMTALGIALAAPAYAATSVSSNGTATAPATPATAPVMKHSRSSKSMGDKVEARIKTLHDKLGVTPDQEGQWNDVAQAMRDNEANLKSLVEDRHNNSETMTAVEDMMSYEKIAQAHADGLGRVASAFEPLYDGMSDDQKKNADEVFGRFEGHRGGPAVSDMNSGTGKGKKTASAPASNQ